LNPGDVITNATLYNINVGQYTNVYRSNGATGGSSVTNLYSMRGYWWMHVYITNVLNLAITNVVYTSGANAAGSLSTATITSNSWNQYLNGTRGATAGTYGHGGYTSIYLMSAYVKNGYGTASAETRLYQAPIPVGAGYRLKLANSNFAGLRAGGTYLYASYANSGYMTTTY
jgi:hypothetical protein